MKKTQEEKLKLLKETVLYYTENTLRRCVKDSATFGVICYYNGASNKLVESKGCAIGRLLPTELTEKLDKEFEFDYLNSGVFNIINRLPIEVQGYGCEFLTHLQKLHDTNKCWNSEGLSEVGKKSMNDLIYKINNGLI